MPSGTRDLQRRIKSIGNIRQITRAMQLVATAKMKKSQKKAKDADPYAAGALEILENLTRIERIIDHPYWLEQKGNSIALILITSNRGFCGGLNITLFNQVLSFIKDQQNKGKKISIATVGRKGQNFIKKLNLNIMADFSGLGDHFLLQEIAPLARIATEDYRKGLFQKIYIAYTQFINTLSQKPIIRQILPLELKIFKDIAEIGSKSQTIAASPKYLYEPNANEVFEKLIPHLLEVEIYKALLDARASEHSARMAAMKNATEQAADLMDDLKFTYNQFRQSSITNEIAEISSGVMNAI